MNKTYGELLTSWPVPVDFHDAVSFESFKACFRFRTRKEEKTSKEATKAPSLKAILTP